MKEFVSRVRTAAAASSVKQRIIAIAAFILAAGGITAGVFALRHRAKPEQLENTDGFSMNAAAMENTETISANGTISSAQLYESVGMESTAIQLEVAEVLTESGATVTAGTALYSLTEDSVASAQATLEKELRSAEDALLKENLSYAQTKSETDALYQSERLQRESAESTYQSSMTQLDSQLQSAWDSYQEAVSTINNAPSEISAKETELATLESEMAAFSSQLTELQTAADTAKNAYTTTNTAYNEATASYNAIAGTVQYIGQYLGLDVSDVQLAGTSEILLPEESETPSEGGTPPADGNFPSDMPDFDGDFSMQPLSYTSSSEPITEGIPQDTTDPPTENAMMTLYENARAEYEAAKALLAEKEAAKSTAQEAYQSAQAAVTQCNSEISSRKSSVSTLSSEISTLESNLSSAKSQRSSLEAEYNSLKLSYETEKLTLQNTYDTAMAAYENAKYHYDLTMSTAESALAEAQEAAAIAESNLTVFEECYADGVIEAKQDGMVYSLSYEAGDRISVSSPFVYYVDDTSYGTTVELDQYDVTEIAIGDEVIIYSSETGMTTGKITAISEGEAETLASVYFQVSVVAEGEDIPLYVGQSVNVYFNAMSMDSSMFSDAPQKADGESQNGDGTGGGRPDFGDFDFENMPDMGNFTPPQ